MQKEYQNSINKRQMTKEASMELLQRIRTNAQQAQLLQRENRTPRVISQSASRKVNYFLPIASAAAVIVLIVVAVLLRTSSTSFIKPPAPEIIPGQLGSEEESKRTDPEKPLYQAAKVIIEENASELSAINSKPSKAISLEGKNWSKHLIPVDAVLAEDDDSFQAVASMLVQTLSGTLTEDKAWQNAPAEEIYHPGGYSDPPFNKLVQYINLSLTGEVERAYSQAGYHKDTIFMPMLDEEKTQDFLRRIKRNIDRGYPLITYHNPYSTYEKRDLVQNHFILINGYLADESGQIQALYFMEANPTLQDAEFGGQKICEVQSLFEGICSFQHRSYYLFFEDPAVIYMTEAWIE